MSTQGSSPPSHILAHILSCLESIRKQLDFLMFTTMSIELSSSSHVCNNLCSTATEGANKQNAISVQHDVCTKMSTKQFTNIIHILQKDTVTKPIPA